MIKRDQKTSQKLGIQYNEEIQSLKNQLEEKENNIDILKEEIEKERYKQDELKELLVGKEKQLKKNSETIQ